MAYRNVYFRINSAYRGYSGWADPADENRFREESRQLFESNGWTLQMGGNGVSDTVTKGDQELYLHPQNFSGVVSEAEIDEIKALLAGAKSFQCQGVDCYEEYLDISNEDYQQWLESERDNIHEALLAQCKTPRRNLYRTGCVIDSVVEKFSLNRVYDKHGEHDLAKGFVQELFADMIAKGEIAVAETKHGTGYRAVQNAEPQQVDGQMQMC